MCAVAEIHQIKSYAVVTRVSITWLNRTGSPRRKSTGCLELSPRAVSKTAACTCCAFAITNDVDFVTVGIPNSGSISHLNALYIWLIASKVFMMFIMSTLKKILAISDGDDDVDDDDDDDIMMMTLAVVKVMANPDVEADLFVFVYTGMTLLRNFLPSAGRALMRRKNELLRRRNPDLWSLVRKWFSCAG